MCRGQVPEIAKRFAEHVREYRCWIHGEAQDDRAEARRARRLLTALCTCADLLQVERLPTGEEWIASGASGHELSGPPPGPLAYNYYSSMSAEISRGRRSVLAALDGEFAAIHHHLEEGLRLYDAGRIGAAVRWWCERFERCCREPARRAIAELERFLQGEEGGAD